MRLIRIGEPGTERPAVLDRDDVARDLTGLVDDYGPAFFASGGGSLVARALDRGGLPQMKGRIGPPIARPGKVVCIGLIEPADLINTGTPAGVALGRPDEPYLRDGDHVELEIDGLGQARQRFVMAS